MPKLEVRLSAEEKELLQKDAEATGKTVSAYVRAMLFMPPPPLAHKHPLPESTPDPSGALDRQFYQGNPFYTPPGK